MNYRNWPIYLFFTIAIAVISPARAEPEEIKSSGDLLSACKVIARIGTDSSVEPTDGRKAVFCMGYMTGILAGVNYYADVRHDKSVCIPSEANVGQIVATFVKWGGDNPQNLHLSAAVGTFSALKQYFPCHGK